MVVVVVATTTAGGGGGDVIIIICSSIYGVHDSIGRNLAFSIGTALVLLSVSSKDNVGGKAYKKNDEYFGFTVQK